MQKSGGCLVLPMTSERRAVAVKQVPANVDGEQGKNFIREIMACVEVSRPRIVLDCSSVQEPGKPVLHLLLHCLEAAMKRNGDIKLAAIPQRTRALLQSARMHRLFEMFDTTAAAVNSFYQTSLDAASQGVVFENAEQESESAA